VRFDLVTSPYAVLGAAHHLDVVNAVTKTVYRLGAVAALGCLTACGSPPSAHDDDGDLAVWDVAAQQRLAPDSTGFTAMVTRTDCGSGKQGRPVAPAIDAGASAITITFRIKPHVSSGTCQGTPGVPYRVRLGEPLGQRTLVDGACLPPGTAGLKTTSFCLEHGMRLTWRNGQPRFFYVP
jgi:hypothetical protein